MLLRATTATDVSKVRENERNNLKTKTCQLTLAEGAPCLFVGLQGRSLSSAQKKAQLQMQAKISRPRSRSRVGLVCPSSQ